MNRKWDEQIDVLSILKDLILQWYVIVLLAVAASLFTNIWVTEQYEPIYTTRTVFTVSAKSLNADVYQNLTSTKSLATRFGQLLESNLLKNKVAETLGQEKFTAQTSVSQLNETNLVELTVTDSSAIQAYQVIKAIMENYSTVSDYVLGDVTLRVIEEPSVPTGPSNGVDVSGAMKKSFRITALAAAVLICVLSFLRDTAKNPEQAKAKIDAHMLGTIYHERKLRGIPWKQNPKSVSMRIDSPLRSFMFVESNRLVASRIRSAMEKQNKQVVMITSVMENEGKSTVAANLAIALAQEGKRVLLLDCDLKKPAQHKIFDGLKIKEGTDVEKIGGVPVCLTSSGLRVILGSSLQQLTQLGQQLEPLEQLLQACRKEADFIVVDTAPMALAMDAEAVAPMADAAVLVVREDVVPAEGINDAIDQLNRTGSKVLGFVFSNSFQRLGGVLHSYGYGYGYGYGRGGYGGYYGK